MEKKQTLEIIRGTTPYIRIKIKNDIDLNDIIQAWVYINQSKKVVVDKTITDVEINPEEKTLLVHLTQQESLRCKAGDAIFQIRLLLSDLNALATVATEASILEIYKDGVVE